MRFDLTDLRLFLAVTEAGSITHGAAEAGLSLPAASERLRALELEGGARLLDRGPRGVTPTEAGEALAHHARLILRQMAQMRGEIARYAEGPRVTIRLAANTAALTEFLPGRLAPWLAAHPRIDLSIKERQSGEIAQAVAAGRAEIGILAAVSAPADLVLWPFAVDRLVVVAARGDPLAGRRRIGFSEVLARDWIGLTEGALADHLDAQAARLGGRPKLRLRLRDFDGICRMAAAGVGIGIVPETAARRCRRALPVTVLRLSDAWATRQLSICTRAPEDLPPAARDLADHLAQADYRKPRNQSNNPASGEPAVSGRGDSRL